MIASLPASASVPPGVLPRRGEAIPQAREASPRQAAPAISPRLRIDGALNLVVMEFRTPEGEVLHSLPTPRQLAAYRDEPREAPLWASLDRTS